MKKLFGSITDFFKYEYKSALGIFIALVEIVILVIIFRSGIAFDIIGKLILVLAITPWIVFGVFANAKNDKYQKFGFNEKNVQVILNAINSPASASYVVSEYEKFISLEKMSSSFMANYFIPDKCKIDKFKYEYAAKEYSLYRFCKLFTLFAFCEDYSIKEYPDNQEEIIQLAKSICPNVSEYIPNYYYRSKSSIIAPYDLERILASYIAFTVFHKQKISFNSFIRFAYDYSVFNKSDNKANELHNFWVSNNLKRETEDGYYIDDTFRGINSYRP